MMKWSPSVMSDFWPDPMDCSLPGSSVLGIFQARVLEWGAISFSRRFSPPRDQTRVSCIVERCFTAWATREVSEISWWNQLVIFRRQYFGQQTPPNSHIHGGVFLWHTPGPMPTAHTAPCPLAPAEQSYAAVLCVLSAFLPFGVEMADLCSRKLKKQWLVVCFQKCCYSFLSPH